MEIPAKSLAQAYITTRRNHPAWQLLAAHRAPLVISCLKLLFETHHEGDGIAFEDALQFLAEIFFQHANHEEFGINADDHFNLANKELRAWIKKGLVVERKGRLFATDALQMVMQFVDGLDNRMMTSTASRLAIVQREIENLESSLNPDPKSRVNYLKKKIRLLEEELNLVASGEFEVLEGRGAIEGIREVYNLAMSLRGDFRRVEDSYRDADRGLRQSIISEHRHRGEIVDKLLDSHDDLLETTEGQVFHGFYEQLNRSVELESMKERLRTILNNPASEDALNRRQRKELSRLVINLVKESIGIIRARARSERDVKGFLKTGLASENHRVGEILMEILEAALEMDWSAASLRRSPGPLPPISIAVSNIPLAERLRFHSIDSEGPHTLNLETQSVNLDEVGDEFWEAFDGLDRMGLIEQTRCLLAKTGQEMGLADLSLHLMSSHDLETLALWLGLVREAELPVSKQTESIEVAVAPGRKVCFHVPKVALTAKALDTIDWEKLG